MLKTSERSKHQSCSEKIDLKSSLWRQPPRCLLAASTLSNQHCSSKVTYQRMLKWCGYYLHSPPSVGLTKWSNLRRKNLRMINTQVCRCTVTLSLWLLIFCFTRLHLYQLVKTKLSILSCRKTSHNDSTGFLASYSRSLAQLKPLTTSAIASCHCKTARRRCRNLTSRDLHASI